MRIWKDKYIALGVHVLWAMESLACWCMRASDWNRQKPACGAWAKNTDPCTPAIIQYYSIHSNYFCPQTQQAHHTPSPESGQPDTSLGHPHWWSPISIAFPFSSVHSPLSIHMITTSPGGKESKSKGSLYFQISSLINLSFIPSPNLPQISGS